MQMTISHSLVAAVVALGGLAAAAPQNYRRSGTIAAAPAYNYAAYGAASPACGSAVEVASPYGTSAYGTYGAANPGAYSAYGVYGPASPCGTSAYGAYEPAPCAQGAAAQVAQPVVQQVSQPAVQQVAVADAPCPEPAPAAEAVQAAGAYNTYSYNAPCCKRANNAAAYGAAAYGAGACDSCASNVGSYDACASNVGSYDACASNVGSYASNAGAFEAAGCQCPKASDVVRPEITSVNQPIVNTATDVQPVNIIQPYQDVIQPVVDQHLKPVHSESVNPAQVQQTYEPCQEAAGSQSQACGSNAAPAAYNNAACNAGTYGSASALGANAPCGC